MKYKKTAKALKIVVLILAVFLFAQIAQAANLEVGLNYATATGLGTQDIRVTIANVIRAFLGLLGLLAIAVLLYGGYVWMTAAGNEEKVKKAKQILINGVIGLLIILSAYGIASFIIGSILGGGGAGGGGGEGAVPPGGGGGALGAGIIESHYPGRNATGIPRNTSIVITFKEPMDVNSLETAGEINSANVKVHPSASSTNVVDISAHHTQDLKTFVYKPTNLLGEAGSNTTYVIELSNAIKKSDGSNAFGLEGYNWQFEISTLVDNTPPQIIGIIPVPGTATYPRNTVVQINFSEPINPMTIRGKSDSYNIISVKNGQAVVAGEFFYGNQYQTVEFVTNDLCGKNSCGGNVYCLPGPASLSVLVKAATIDNSGKANFGANGYDGIVDMADNSLDGNGNNKSEGPQSQTAKLPFDANNPGPLTQGDDYTWSFSTSSVIDLIPPEIINYSPDANSSGVSPLGDFLVTFSKIMMATTLKPGSGYGDGLNYITLTQPQNLPVTGYWISSTNNFGNNQTTASIGHSTLFENSNYGLSLGSGLKDITQNCYSPCSGPNCVRVPTSTPGQYQQGSPWQGTYPSCNLGQ
ncbi:MAG: Ig-like domain-containing protein [Patescibacteria group bacterium]|nr:Ig-like domain-containing protein [Patescibacteria group bacterium]